MSRIVSSLDAFETLSSGTIAQDAVLEIQEIPARFWCMTCRTEFQSDDFFSECPGCHRPSGDLRAGREMELASMEIE